MTINPNDVSPGQLAADVAAFRSRGGRASARAVLRQAWDVFEDRFMEFLAAGMLLLVVGMLTNAPAYIDALKPLVVSQIINPFAILAGLLSLMLATGIQWYARQVKHKGPQDFPQFFAVWGAALVPLLALALVAQLLPLLLMLPWHDELNELMVDMNAAEDKMVWLRELSAQPARYQPMFRYLTLVVGPVSIVVSVFSILMQPYLACWRASIPQAVAAAAAQLKYRPLFWLKLLLLLGLVNIAGALLFGIGLVVTMPLTYIAIYLATELPYEDQLTGTATGASELFPDA